MAKKTVAAAEVVKEPEVKAVDVAEGIEAKHARFSLTPNQTTFQSDMQALRDSYTIIAAQLNTAGGKQSFIGIPEDYWNQANIYRGIMYKYGRI